MIKKRLQLIFEDPNNPENVSGVIFTSWKQIHMHLFEHGLYPEFQVTADTGEQMLHYKRIGCGHYSLTWCEKVPGSIVFEIVNKHASAKL